MINLAGRAIVTDDFETLVIHIQNQILALKLPR